MTSFKGGASGGLKRRMDLPAFLRRRIRRGIKLDRQKGSCGYTLRLMRLRWDVRNLFPIFLSGKTGEVVFVRSFWLFAAICMDKLDVMKCESCNINEATIHLTQVVNGVVKKVHICQECAEKSGLDLNSPISITDILLGLGGTQEQEGDLPFEQSCPVCHMRRTDFKKSGRLGCAHCYENFMGEVNSIINAMHHSTQHVGKLPARAGSEARQQAEVATLRQKLDSAIAQEDFEEAARLRDQIRAIQNRGKGDA